MLTSELNQTLYIGVSLPVFFLGYLPSDLHQPYERYLRVGFGHLQVVKEDLLNAASFTQLTPIQGELVSGNEVGEKVVDNHKVVSESQQELHEVKGGRD